MAFAEKMQGIISKGVAEAKDLGARGVLKIEIMQLEGRTENLVTRLGNEVYLALTGGSHATLSRDSPSIRDILTQIEGLRAEHGLLEKKYDSIGGRREATATPVEKP
jgi:hypothetical protein